MSGAGNDSLVTADDDVRAILLQTRTIAVVGASTRESRPSNGVARYLMQQGYAVIPVNPSAVGESLYGEPFTESFSKIPRSRDPIEMVDIFRASDACPETVRDAIAALGQRGLRSIWMQLGVISEEAARIACDAGLRVVMDQCVEIEHTRLVLGAESSQLELSQSG